MKSFTPDEAKQIARDMMANYSHLIYDVVITPADKLEKYKFMRLFRNGANPVFDAANGCDVVIGIMSEGGGIVDMSIRDFLKTFELPYQLPL